MTRRALALALIGSGLSLLAVLILIWAVTGPGLPLRVGLTIALLTGAAIGAVALSRVAGIANRYMQGVRERETRLRRMLDELSAVLHAESDARSALEREVNDLRDELTADLAEKRRDDAARQEAAHSRMMTVEADVRALRSVNRSQDVWALEIESRLHDEEHKLERGLRAISENLMTARRADHARMANAERSFLDLVLRSGVDLTQVYEQAHVATLANRLSRESEYLRIKPLIEAFDVIGNIPLERAIAAHKTYRKYGYLAAQRIVAQHLNSTTGHEEDVLRDERISMEAEFFRDPFAATPRLDRRASVRDAEGPVVHIVGKALPETQTGYTLRTHYTARALQARGIPVVVVCQAGAPGGSDEVTVENIVNDVRYLMLRGSPRHESTYQEWIADNIHRLAEVVIRLRPRVLHAHSDFLNAMIATTVGEAYGIPVVYESRGFWEESWLSRTLDATGETGRDEDLFRAYGLPEAYSWRRRAEIIARERSDANLTLGRTMRYHIRQLARPGTLEDDPIRLVPNGIDPASFDVAERDEALAAELGLVEGALVIGCISSVVEYEGIDLLLRAFAALDRGWREAAPRPRLLVVGDGSQLEGLTQLAVELGIDNATFTGRVPHDEILRYYGLIDIFVVPRRPSPVSQLVTPLKPYEALATGRALVVSDVDALQEVSEDSVGAVEVFPAGSVESLTALLSRLARDPDRRREMSASGARWVRQERTWETNAAVYEQVYEDLDIQAGGSSNPVQVEA